MPKSRHPFLAFLRNIILLALCVLAIISYLWMPFWSINLSYTMDAETLKSLVGDAVDFDAEEIVGSGVKLDISLKFETKILFKSFGDEHTAVGALIDDNVDLFVHRLIETLDSIAENTIRSVAHNHVKQEVHNNIKDMLASKNPGITDGEVNERLNNAGITDEFISSMTDSIIDKIYDGGSTVDEVCDEIVNSVDAVYAKMAASDDPDLQSATFSDEDREAFRASVKETMENLAAQDGTIDADTLMASLFQHAIDRLTGSGDSASNAAAPLADEEGTEETEPTSGEKLEKNVRDFLVELIPEDIYSIIMWVMRGMVIMFFFSSFWWAYIVIKLFAKLLTEKDTRVKLKAPIWLGWLPFLLLVCLPTAVLWFKGSLASVLPESIMSIINSTGVSFSSAGWVAAAAALVCFVISIFNMVARKKQKNAAREEE